jgi:hypothetical protein
MTIDNDSHLKDEPLKHFVRELLDELPGLSPDELPDWNIRAEALLVFTAIEQLKDERLPRRN